MNLPAALDDHFSLCQEVHTLLLEENRILNSTQRPPDSNFLDRKRTLLPRLDAALAELQATWPHVPEQRRAHSSEIERNQQKMLAILLLDRENEKLLLRYSVPAQPTPVVARPSQHLVNRAYGSTMAKRS